VTRWILGANGQPFSDRDAATAMQAVLAAEIGPHACVEVIPHPDGGYAVRYSGPPQPSAAKSSGRAPPYPEYFRLRPALRASVDLMLVASLGLLMLLGPGRFLSWVGLALPAPHALSVAVLLITQAAGLILVIHGVSGVLFRWLSTDYHVDSHGVSSVSWELHNGRLRRMWTHASLSDVRVVRSQQSPLERLLGIGTVTLLLSDGPRLEVSLLDVAAPRRLRDELDLRANRRRAVAAVGLADLAERRP